MRLPGPLLITLVIAASAAVISVIVFVAWVVSSGNVDDSGRPVRAATIDDLPHIVLQPKDVPDEFVQLTANEFTKLKTTGEYSSIASYETAFELPRDQAAPGETVCIVSIAALYPDGEAAEAALRKPIQQLEAAARRGAEAGSQIQDLRVTEPASLPRAVAAEYFSPSTSYCAAFENEPASVHLVRFEDQFQGQFVIGTIAMFVFETGSASDDPMELARLQQDRTRDWLASTGIESPQ